MTAQAERRTMLVSCILGPGDFTMGLHRSTIRRRVREDAAETKARNEIIKGKERVRRDRRMLEKVKAGSLPYTPAVMSWLSRKVGKPAGSIAPEDIKVLLG